MSFFSAQARASLVKRPVYSPDLLARISSRTSVQSGRRSLATRPSHGEPAELSYDLHAAPDGNTSDGALVIAHGFLGSKRNWGSLSKLFASTLRRPVYALDMRNHGHSPAAAPHNYQTMASDIHHFIRSRDLRNVQLIGHSMGGKAVMAYALSEEAKQEDRLEKLVVVDIAPSVGKIGQEFFEYVRAMKGVNDAGLSSRKEAQAALSKVESDPAVLAFLMTNLEVDRDGVRFRPSLDTLLDSVEDVGSFPYQPGEVTWDGPALFVKGKNSAYINRKNQPLAEELFPNMKLEVLDAGHWVHAERPNEFKELLLNFLGRKE